jgi:O-antigen ligase
MPEHIRALVVILVVAAAVLHVARPMAVELVPAETFSRWRTAWFGLTLALFLSHSFWVYALLLVVGVRYVARREQHLVGLFLFLLFVAPPASMNIPGLGVFNQLFPINHYNLLVMVLFVPLALRLSKRRSSLNLGKSPVDKMVLGYLAVICILAFRNTSVTGGLRLVFMHVIDIFVPYYVVSRGLRSIEDFRYAFLGLAMGAALLSSLALFEVMRYWKLYQGVLVALGFSQWQLGGYLERMGVLRPDVSVGNSIVLGYVIMTAVGCYLFLMSYMRNSWRRQLGLALLVGGVIWALSRGPWVGLCLLLLVFVFTGTQVVSRLFKLVAFGSMALLVALQFPAGQFLLDLLPFIGKNEAGSVEYREDLLTQALPVIGRNLWFGSTDYLSAPELQNMYSGGIIDIVNTYLGVVLDYGIIGLAFFAGAFVFATLHILHAIRRARKGGDHAVLLGRALLAVLLSIMLAIYTMSSMGVVPIIYWIFLGTSVAYYQMILSNPDVEELEGRRV